jgi:hypothetical protein
VGLPVNKLFLFLACGAMGTGAPAWAYDVNQCVASNSKFIKTADEQLKSFGVDPDKPCPEQDLYDAEEKKCSSNVSELRKIDKELRGIMKEKCENAGEIEKLANANSGQQKDSQDKGSDVYAKGAAINKREYEKLGELSKQVKEMRKFYAEIADGARQIQEKVDERAKSDPNGKDEHTDKLQQAGSRRGVQATSNQQARNLFKDAIGTVANAVSKASSSGISKAEADQVKTPLAAEPLKIAAAATDWDKQIEARQKVVQSQGMLYQQNNGTTSNRSSGLGEADKNSTGGQAASSNGGSGSGGSDAAGSMGQAAQAMQAASGLAGAAGGGGASSGGASGAPAAGDYGSFDTGSYSNGTTTAGGSLGSGGSSGSGSTKGGRSSTGSKDGVSKIDNLESIVKTDGKTGTGITGSSSSKGSSLREALRERLSQTGGDSGGGGGSTEASVAGGGGSGSGSSASSGAVTPDLLPASTSVASDNPLEASEGSVGGDLGNTDFSLAGSETDAAVKGMLKDFGVGDSASPDRSLASEHQAPEILASDSPSLFMRTRETHQRSLKKGLVINGLRAKL